MIRSEVLLENKPNYIVKEEILFDKTQNNTDKNKGNGSKSNSSGTGNIIFMKSVSIAPQNHFKKIKKRVYDRNLDASNTSWVHAFNSCLKYDLFHAKVIMSHEPKVFYDSIGKVSAHLSSK